MNWKKHPPSVLHPQSECFYQELIKEIGDEQIYAEIVEWKRQWDDNKITWELHIQIPKEWSITKKTINTNCFHYDKLDFDKIKKDAKKIIKALTKIK